MAVRTWQGPANGAWFDPTAWSPSGVPQPGDRVVVSSGGPTVAANGGAPLDAEQVTLGGNDFAQPATLTSDGATFGRGFAITTRSDAPYATFALAGPTVFDGTLSAIGGQVGVEAGTDLQGAGTTRIAKGATVSFTGTVPGTQTVSFLDPNGTLLLNDPASFGAQITGLQTGDRIELGGKQVATSASYADGKLTITGEGGTIAALNVVESGGPLNLYASPFGHGGSVITTSQEKRVWDGGKGNWYDASSWQNGVPLGGDTVSIPSGKAVLSRADAATYGALDFENIILGTAGDHAPVTLQSTDAAFGAGASITTRGTPQYVPDYVQPEETWVARGTTRFDGTVFDEAHGGKLTIDAESDGSSANFIITGVPNPVLDVSTFATVFVGQESRLDFIGGTVTNNGLILVDGHAEVGQSVDLQGGGTTEVEAGGSVSIAGSVSDSQTFVFGDDRGTLKLSNLAGFKARVEVAERGDRIELANVQAQSVSYDSGTLTLEGANGQPVGQLAVTDPNRFGAQDFTLSSDGQGGTRITYTPQGPVTLKESLPVAAVGATGALIPMKDLLIQAFGSIPTGYASYTLSAPLGNLNSDSYWQQPPNGTPKDSAWYYDGQPITQAMTVSASDLDHVTYYAGNNIYKTPSLTVPVATGADGTATEFIQYNVWTVDPSANAPETGSGPTSLVPPEPGSRFGQVNPSDIVDSAYRYNSVDPGVLNTDNCNWIADNLAAGAGAVMPYDDASTDPTQNVSGGFWRIVYRGSDSSSPVRDWSTLTQPGDVVRMGRLDENGEHTTTVVGTVNPDGSLPVYDNGDHNAQGEAIIGVHDATYWTGTDPSTITIYRLDPEHQYLIQGTSQPEFLQGSVFDNLIQPGGGKDTITAGAGNNEVQDTTAHLDGITITDFHFGDTLDFTDLAQGGATASFGDGALTVGGAGAKATIALPGQSAGASFVTNSDGHGGTLVGLVPTA